jgi:hypothetical protein
VVVLVVVVVVVGVDVLGLVVVAAVVDGAVGWGRVGAGSEVGLGAPLDPAVVLAIWGVVSVAPSIRLAASAIGPTLGSVVVGPAMVALDVVEGKVRSAPVNSSQADPQPAPWVNSAKATMKTRAAMTEIADTRTSRRSHQLRTSRGTTWATRLRPLPRREVVSWA